MSNIRIGTSDLTGSRIAHLKWKHILIRAMFLRLIMITERVDAIPFSRG
jgi:hypothetical protein